MADDPKVPDEIWDVFSKAFGAEWEREPQNMSGLGSRAARAGLAAAMPEIQAAALEQAAMVAGPAAHEVRKLAARLPLARPVWDDGALPEDEAIGAAHPTRSADPKADARYAEAMRLVGARRSKHGLVELVAWLLERSEHRAGAILQRLHDSEINASISSFFDGCFTARLGDDMNGFIAEETVPTLEAAERWLFNEALIRFPASSFAIEVARDRAGG